ncbi:MAG: CDP-glycerol glycerophosphotransferase family protein [Candidatus Omnitrophica bacterium]|nr:CDP-glycerol glycerophosphotransferase family protein [Candidatus Omnitrophota bacterium]
MKLILFGYVDKLSSLCPFLRRHSLPGGAEAATLVSMNRFAGETLGLGEIMYSEEFLKKEDFEYMDEYISRTSRICREFLSNDEKTSALKGIKVTDVLELEIYMYLCTVIKNLQVTLNIVEAINPSEILIIGEKSTDGLEQISRFLAERLNIKSTYITVKNGLVPEAGMRKICEKASSFAAKIITELLDRLERFLLLRSRKHGKSIIMDYRFPELVKGIEKEHVAMPYIAGWGLRIRLNFIKQRKLYLSFLKVHNPLNKRRGRGYFLAINKILEKGFAENEYLRYRGYNIYRILKNIFREQIENELPLMKENISMLCRFFDGVGPKAVIVRDSTRNWEHALTLVAKSKNLPSIVVQHGITSIMNVYAKQHATAVAFWGDVYLRLYKAAGTDTSKSKVTGYPQHDRIYAGQGERYKRYRKILSDSGADPDKKTVVYLASCIKYYPINSVYLTPEVSFFLLREVLSVFGTLKNLQLIIKLHPFYDRQEYPRFKEEVSGFTNAFIVRNADIPDLFSGSICVVSELFSSAIMDAIILKKPVIFFNAMEKEEAIPIEERKVGIEVRSRADLMDALQRIVASDNTHDLFPNKAFEDFVGDFAYKVDGRSSERVRHFINDLIPSA